MAVALLCAATLFEYLRKTIMPTPIRALSRLSLVFCAIGVLVARPAYAGWLNDAAEVVKAVVLSEAKVPVRLQPTSAAAEGLPAHWRAYWLEEPEFNTRLFVAEAGNQDLPVVFLVHGLGQNGLRDWRELTPLLEDHYRVVLIDLPGFGLSPAPKTKLSPTRYAKLLHFVKPFFSVDPIAVVGHSMGGAITLRYAHSYPADVERIALIDAAGILQRTAFIKHSAADRLPLKNDTTMGALLPYAASMQSLTNALIEKVASLPDPTTLLGKSDMAWGQALGANPNINAALGLVGENFSTAIFEQTRPTSILWGADDLIAPVRTAKVLQSALPQSGNAPGANGVRWVAGAGHMVIVTHAPQVAEWLQQQLLPVANSAEPAIEPEEPIARSAEGEPALVNAVLPNNPGLEGSVVNDPSAKQNYSCNGTSGGELRGVYGLVSLTNCKGLQLQGVVADAIIASHSIFEVNNTDLQSTGTALMLDDSVAVITGGHIAGTVELNDARIDMAGVNLALPQPFIIKTKSRLVLSVSRAGQRRYLHADVVLKEVRY